MHVINLIGFGPHKGKAQAVLLNSYAGSNKPQKTGIYTPGTEEESRMIIGGSDGRLITIDEHGQIHVLPSEGPGDPEVKKAVASINESILVLTRVAAAAGAGS